MDFSTITIIIVYVFKFLNQSLNKNDIDIVNFFRRSGIQQTNSSYIAAKLKITKPFTLELLKSNFI